MVEVVMVDSNQKEVILSVKNLEVSFGDFKAVNDVSFDVYKGETLSIVGESGSGKTTIGRAIVRINPVSKGEILFEGKKISGKIDKELDKWVIENIQMVFQDPAASLNERATIDYIVSEGIKNFGLYENEEDRKAKVITALENVGLLPEHISRYPHEFSGGQRQRIGLARAMIMEPKLLVADEPISALDVSIRAQVMNLLRDLQINTGLTTVFIAHDLSVVRFVSDRIAVINKGRIVELAESEELFRNTFHAYTKSLLSAIPLPDPEVERNKILIVYNPEDHNYGDEKPELREVLPGHFVLCSEKEFKQFKSEIKE
jgi:oligopeptide transport system ATP-binding protein